MSLRSSIPLVLTRIYRTVFARRCCWKLNLFLHNLSLRGMGILNYENRDVSGEKSFLQDYLGSKNQSIVIDVGANKGEYAALVIDIQPTAIVYALEPHPVSFRRLQSGVEGKNIRVFNLACDANNGSITLYDYPGNEGSEHATVYKEALEKDTVSYVVTAVTLDDFVRQNSIAEIDLLKIDVEGNEYGVLKGCAETIRKNMIKAIHFEFNEMNTLSRIFFKDFVLAFPEYVFFRMLPSGLIPLGEYRPLLHEIFAFQNIVAIHRTWMDEQYRKLL